MPTSDKRSGEINLNSGDSYKNNTFQSPQTSSIEPSPRGGPESHSNHDNTKLLLKSDIMSNSKDKTAINFYIQENVEPAGSELSILKKHTDFSQSINSDIGEKD